tara:strand:+ start:176 stop:619 length:444 start_codon:yes stop_codon:yes gene_type:complete
MKNKLFFFIISFTLLFGCVAKKTSTEYKEIIKRDSTYFKKDRIITPRVVDTLYVDNPCDTVTGSLKDFEKEIRTNNAKVVLKSVKGSIQVSVNIDSIVSSKITEFKQNYESETHKKDKAKVIFRTPLWVWLLILLESLVIFLLIRFK